MTSAVPAHGGRQGRPEAYTITSITSLTWPDQSQLVSRVMMPLYFAEVPIIFWLLIKGAAVPRSETKPGQADGAA